MREILFKGKSKKDSGWVVGYVFDDDLIGSNKMFVGSIVIEADDVVGHCFCEVIPETISRCTGLNDVNGKEIFENDIIRSNDYRFIVAFGRSAKGYLGFYLKGYDKKTKMAINQGLRNDIYFWLEEYGVEVVGNLFDEL